MGIILTETNSEIEAKIKEAIASHINMLLKKNVPNIQSSCKQLAGEWIMAQPELASLVSGDPDSLAGLFGIRSGQVASAVNAIVTSVQESVSVFFDIFDKSLQGTLEIRFQPSGFENLLSLPSGRVIYKKGVLHWLNWLLTLGPSPIIANYHYEANPGTGRSGLGTMKVGSSFRVPIDFAGTLDDNFVTRALIGKAQEKAIGDLLMGYLK